jgi:hypothetical protein
MANVLQKIFNPTIDEVVQNYTIQSWHVSQSVDAFTGAEAYDITLSGSLVVTGSVAINTLPNSPQNGVVLYDDVTGLLYYTASSAFAVNNFYTSSITQSFSSSVVNNTVNNSTVNQTIVNSIVNQPAPNDQYIQYNSASGFGASISFQYVYPSESLQQGSGTLALGNYSHAQGKDTRSVGASSHTEGLSTLASGLYSHAEGTGTLASGLSSHTEGNATTASNDHTHAEGDRSRASGVASHAEGLLTQATATGSHSEGGSTQATGNYSHTEGFGTVATNAFAHAEGFATAARGIGAHSEGEVTIAQGNYSHAEGQSTLSLGNYSHAEGYLTTSSAGYSHAAGVGTVSSGIYQFVAGSHNISSSNASAFIIGNGTSNASRSNLIFASGSLFSVTGSANISSTLTTSGSRVRRYRTITLTDADWSTAPSKQVQSDDDILLIIDNTTSIGLAGEGNLSITSFLNSSAGRCVEIVKIKDGVGGGGIVIINSTMAGSPILYLNNATQPDGTRAICPSVGNSITLMSLGVTPSGSAWGNGY